MSLYVVSDLHIRDERDPLYRSVIEVLARAKEGDTAVLAGDIFDLFVGNKAVFTGRYQEFLSALRGAGERGVALHYIEGNHDFLLAKALGPARGVHHHAEDVAFEIAGRRFFVAHGDTADREDYGYRVLRAFFRGPLIRAFVAVAPGPGWMASGARARSAARRRRRGFPGRSASRACVPFIAVTRRRSSPKASTSSCSATATISTR